MSLVVIVGGGGGTSLQPQRRRRLPPSPSPPVMTTQWRHIHGWHPPPQQRHRSTFWMLLPLLPLLLLVLLWIPGVVQSIPYGTTTPTTTGATTATTAFSTNTAVGFIHTTHKATTTTTTVSPLLDQPFRPMTIQPQPPQQPQQWQRQHGSMATLPRMTPTTITTRRLRSSRSSSTRLYFMGSDSGLLGVGGPELFTIILVGYFVLGPSDMYKLVKEIGKFIQNIRTLGTDLSTTFENNMESSLQLEELRKAQRELNDAFSFRRSINVNADSDAFAVSETPTEEALTTLATTVSNDLNATTTTTTTDDTMARRKTIRRRVRKVESVMSSTDRSTPNGIPDLIMPESATTTTTTTYQEKPLSGGISEQEAAEIEAEFNQYVGMDSRSSTMTTTTMTPFSGLDARWNRKKDDDELPTPTTLWDSTDSIPDDNPAAAAAAAQGRFQQQVSGQWNNQILAAGDTLEPMALIMNKIALLEQEKAAAIRRLQEEYAERSRIENMYYQEQRQLLEQVAIKVQTAAFGVDSITSTSTSTPPSTTTTTTTTTKL